MYIKFKKIKTNYFLNNHKEIKIELFDHIYIFYTIYIIEM